MKTRTRYNVVKARVRPRIYVAGLEIVDGLIAGASGFRCTRWTTDPAAARAFTLAVAQAVARRNAHCVTILKR